MHASVLRMDARKGFKAGQAIQKKRLDLCTETWFLRIIEVGRLNDVGLGGQINRDLHDVVTRRVRSRLESSSSEMARLQPCSRASFR